MLSRSGPAGKNIMLAQCRHLVHNMGRSHSGDRRREPMGGYSAFLFMLSCLLITLTLCFPCLQKLLPGFSQMLNRFRHHTDRCYA